MDNAIRQHLVARIRCTDCGNPLLLSYSAKDGVMAKSLCDDGITGAAKVEAAIWAEPCRHCVGSARKPIQMMREALASIPPEAD